MSFPLYDNLNVDLPKKDLTAKQKTELMQQIQDLDTNALELVYALIQFYANKFKTDDTLPYKGEKMKTEDENLYNIKWNLTELPIPLRQILWKFTNMHLKTSQENAHREL